MIEFIQSIKGPHFLAYYFIYSIIIFMLTWFFKNIVVSVFDDSRNFKISLYMASFMKTSKNMNRPR